MLRSLTRLTHYFRWSKGARQAAELSPAISATLLLPPCKHVHGQEALCPEVFEAASSSGSSIVNEGGSFTDSVSCPTSPKACLTSGDRHHRTLRLSRLSQQQQRQVHTATTFGFSARLVLGQGVGLRGSMHQYPGQQQHQQQRGYYKLLNLYNMVQPVETKDLNFMLRKVVFLEHAALPVLKYSRWMDPTQTTGMLVKLVRVMKSREGQKQAVSPYSDSRLLPTMLQLLGDRFLGVLHHCSDAQLSQGLWALGALSYQHEGVLEAATRRISVDPSRLTFKQLATIAWGVAASSASSAQHQNAGSQLLHCIAKHLNDTAPELVTHSLLSPAPVSLALASDSNAPTDGSSSSSIVAVEAQEEEQIAVRGVARAAGEGSSLGGGSGGGGRSAKRRNARDARQLRDKKALGKVGEDVVRGGMIKKPKKFVVSSHFLLDPELDHRSILKLAWAFAVCGVKNEGAVTRLVHAAVDRIEEQLKLHDPSQGPLTPRTIYRYRTIKGLQDLNSPRPDKPSKYLRSTAPVVTVHQDFTTPTLASLLGCLTQLGHGQKSASSDNDSTLSSSSGISSTAVAERLLPAVALHLLASGDSAVLGGVKEGDLRQMLGACRAAHYRNPDMLATLLSSTHLDAYSPHDLLSLARDCAFHGLDDTMMLRRISRVLLPRAEELSLEERVQLAYICAKGAYHDPALLQPLIEHQATQPDLQLPPKALSQLLYAASRLPVPAPPVLMQSLQQLVIATNTRSQTKSFSGASTSATATSSATNARLLTMLLAWEGHDKAAVLALAGQMQSQMSSLQPHRAESLRAAVVKADVGVKL